MEDRTGELKMADRTYLEQLLDDMEPAMREAFLQALRDISSQVVLRALVDRLAAGDLDGAASVFGLEPEVFSGVADAQETTYRDAGVLVADAQRVVRTPEGARLVLRFNVRNPRAEEWLRTESSRLVLGLSRTAKKTVRAALSAGMERGLNPKTTALDVVGRVSAQTGRREGGVLGLTPTQLGYVERARAELLSGDPAALRRYLGRQRRDARFDARVRRAIESGKPLLADDVRRMIGRYSDRLLQLRGETIARTETILALHAGQEEAMRQGIESGKIAEDDIEKIWHHVADSRVRHSHVLLGGKHVPYSEAFVSPISGARMMYPGDTKTDPTRITGADTINCRCHAEYRVDYVGAAARRFRARQKT